MEDLTQESPSLSDAQVDALLSGQEAAAETPAQPQTAEQAQPEKDTEPEYEINFKGQLERLPLSKLIEFAQQGRNYSQQKNQLNLERNKWTSELGQRDQAINQYKKDLERLQQYQEIEAYQKKDPNWWAHVVENYQKARQGLDQGANGVNPELVKRLDSVESVISQINEEKKLQQQTAQDQQLETSVQEYRTKYPDLDWHSKDQTGFTLEQRIMQHALDNGISRFRAAANDFLADDLNKRAAMKARDDVAKKTQENFKKGIGQQSRVPQLRKPDAKEVSDKSYDQLIAEALQEYGITQTN